MISGLKAWSWKKCPVEWTLIIAGSQVQSILLGFPWWAWLVGAAGAFTDYQTTYSSSPFTLKRLVVPLKITLDKLANLTSSYPSSILRFGLFSWHTVTSRPCADGNLLLDCVESHMNDFFSWPR
jgi:hypothetical protein